MTVGAESGGPRSHEGGLALVGRDHELARLNAAFGDAAAGEMRALLIDGEDGAGKSRLVREAFALARERGCRFASGGAYDANGRPFGPIVDMLRAARRGARLPEEEAALDGAIAQLADVEDAGAPRSRWRQVDALVDAIAAGGAADPPLRVVALEDLHRADESTLELLTHVVRQLEPLPVLVLATFRAPEPGADRLLALIDSARSLPCSERLTLAPLPRAAAEKLARAAAGTGVPDEVIASIAERAGGNPLLLEEAARDAGRALRQSVSPPLVPGAVQELVQGRLSQLDPRAKEVIHAIAVLGGRHDSTVVATLLGVRTSELAPALRALTARDLLATEADGRLSCRHALTRDAVYQSIPPVRRRELHLACAEAIEAHEGLRVAAEIARHLREVGGVEHTSRAASLLARAGEESLAQLAYEQAAAQLREAVRLMVDCREDAAAVRQVRLTLAEALRRTRAADAALDAYSLLADEASSADDVATEAMAAIGYEQTYLETGRPRSGVDARSIPLLDRALAHLGVGLDSDDQPATRVAPLVARVLAAGAQARNYAGDRAAALTMARRAAQVAESASTPGAEAAALNTVRMAVTGPDTLSAALDLTRRIVDLAAEAGDIELEMEGLLWRIGALLEEGKRTESEAALGRFTSLAQRVRHPWRLSEAHRMQGMFAHLSGDLPAARVEAEEALRLGLLAGHLEARSPYVVMLALTAGAADLRAEADRLLRSRTLEPTNFRWQAFIGWLALASGDRDRATRLGAMAMESGIETLPRDQGWFSFLAVFAELAIELHEPAWARAAYDVLLPYADRYLVIANGAACYGSAEGLLAQLAEAAGVPDPDAHRRRAVERNEAIAARVWLHSTDAIPARVTKTFMFTDIVQSTSLAGVLGDEAWGVLLRWHDETLGTLFREYSGEQVVSTGDGFFVAFEDPDHAVACAIAIQRRLAEHRSSSGFAPEVRIGLHTTEASAEQNNYHGRGVHEAARIAALAGGGEIVASAHTAAAHARAGSARTVTLRGIPDPAEIVTIAW